MWILAVVFVVAMYLLMLVKENFPFLALAAVGAATAGTGAAGFSFLKSGRISNGVGKGPGAEDNGSPFNMNGSFAAFYADVDFKGPYRSYSLGVEQNSLSKGKFGLGWQKENDTYSSAIVPNGLKVIAYQDNDRKGPSITLGPGKYSNLGSLNEGNWNDRISSLVVVKA